MIFILIGWVLFLFLRELKISKTIASIVTSFYLLNPFHYEMVWWISARKDLLAIFFLICSALFWLRFIKQGTFKNALFCYLFFCLSLMSKTTFVLFPYALFVCHHLRGDLKRYLSWLTLGELPLLAGACSRDGTTLRWVMYSFIICWIIEFPHH